MPNIHVCVHPNVPFHVDLDPCAALWGHYLLWHIHCTNPAVRRVRIEFENDPGKPTPAFFPTSPQGATMIEKDLAQGGEIWGQVPVPGNSSTAHPTRIGYKYTIRALDGTGQPIYDSSGQELMLDPEIITDKP